MELPGRGGRGIRVVPFGTFTRQHLHPQIRTEDVVEEAAVVARHQTAVHEIKDMVVAGNVAKGCSLSFTLTGEPKAQERPTFHHVANHTGCFVHDPCRRQKMHVRAAVRAALREMGVSHFPMFSPIIKVRVNAVFYIANSEKDTENMLKFIGDALKGVIFPNDRQVYSIHGDKEDVPVGNSHTTIYVTRT